MLACMRCMACMAGVPHRARVHVCLYVCMSVWCAPSQHGPLPKIDGLSVVHGFVCGALVLQHAAVVALKVLLGLQMNTAQGHGQTDEGTVNRPRMKTTASSSSMTARMGGPGNADKRLGTYTHLRAFEMSQPEEGRRGSRGGGHARGTRCLRAQPPLPTPTSSVLLRTRTRKHQGLPSVGGGAFTFTNTCCRYRGTTRW